MGMSDAVNRARKIRELLAQEIDLLFDEVEESRHPAIWLSTKEIKAELMKRGTDTKSWETRLYRLLSLAARPLEGEKDVIDSED